MKIAITIPIYKANLNNLEKLSLQQCVNTLREFDIFFIEPHELDSSEIRKSFPMIQVEKFEDTFFKDILGYNRLMLSGIFYERFLLYDYILIHQLDAYVFSNQLTQWCLKNYDYIGAPWIGSKPNIFKKILLKLKPKHKQERAKILFKVGNGGFSLRKTQSFYAICQQFPDAIEKTLQKEKKDHLLMEDVFWSTVAPQLNPHFKIPNYQEAVFFAIDRRPHLAFKLTNQVLPFGCHGIDKKNVNEFWKTKIKGL